MADKNPYHELEGFICRVTCTPVIGTTYTAAWWNENAGKGLFVKTDTTQTSSRGHGRVPVEPIEDGDTVPYGRFDTIDGPDDNLRVGITIAGADMWALGNVTTNAALSDANIGTTLQGAGAGKLKIAASGFGCVVGGDQTDLRIAFNGMENVR